MSEPRGSIRKATLATGALVALSVLAAGPALSAPATVTIDIQATGKEKPKLDRKKFKPTSISFGNTITDAANPAGLPPKVTEVVIKFDPKDIKFNPDAVPACDISQLEGKTTQAAIDACPKAKVGSGTATASLPFGTGGTPVTYPAVITAFNRAGGDGILFHARSDALGTAIVLDGTLKGTTLTTTVPPIGGGVGASPQFNVRVQAKDSVQARCKDGKINYRATFNFNDSPPATASDSQPCKKKKR
jgi:hypothetical protein